MQKTTKINTTPGKQHKKSNTGKQKLKTTTPTRNYTKERNAQKATTRK